MFADLRKEKKEKKYIARALVHDSCRGAGRRFVGQ